MHPLEHRDAIHARFAGHADAHAIPTETFHGMVAFLDHPVMHHSYHLAELNTPEAAAEGTARRHASLLLMLATCEHFAQQAYGTADPASPLVDPETARVLTGLRTAVGGGRLIEPADAERS